MATCPNFYGKPNESAEDFLDDLEMALLLNGRNEERTRLQAIALVLKEDARTWYQALKDDVKGSWEALKMAFLKRYKQKENSESLWRDVTELRQEKAEDHATYESSFNGLWVKWERTLGEDEKTPDVLKKEKFMEGLHPRIRDKVRGKFPKTYEEAVLYAKTKSKKLKLLDQDLEENPCTLVPPILRQVEMAAPVKEDPQQELLQHITSQLENLSLNLVQNGRGRRQGENGERRPPKNQGRQYHCYNCGEEGHGMYYCPYPRNLGNAPFRRQNQQVTPPRERPIIA